MPEYVWGRNAILETLRSSRQVKRILIAKGQRDAPVIEAILHEAERRHIPIETLPDRVRHVVQSAFNGKRIVIFSGGPRSEDDAFFAEARAIRDGGGFGSIIGRNSFQRQKSDGLAFLRTVMGIYAGEIQ